MQCITGLKIQYSDHYGLIILLQIYQAHHMLHMICSIPVGRQNDLWTLVKVANRSKQNSQQKKRPPYLKMFKSMPFIAVLVAHTTHLYSMYTFIQLFPKYLGDVQGKSIKDIGFLASMPQALTVFLIIFGSNISDWLYG